MPHIFVSYAREDRRQAKALADLLDSEGFDIWWDRELRFGDRFPEAIERAIWDCHHVVVLWTRHSVESDWVIREATLAKKLDKLLPIQMEDCEIPHGFRSLHTPRFAGWAQLLADLYGRVGGGGFGLYSVALHEHPSRAPELRSIEPVPAERPHGWAARLLSVAIAGLIVASILIVASSMFRVLGGN